MLSSCSSFLRWTRTKPRARRLFSIPVQFNWRSQSIIAILRRTFLGLDRIGGLSKMDKTWVPSCHLKGISPSLALAFLRKLEKNKTECPSFGPYFDSTLKRTILAGKFSPGRYCLCQQLFFCSAWLEGKRIRCIYLPNYFMWIWNHYRQRASQGLWLKFCSSLI